ncbi:hypothetical protein RH728_004234 [Vibrio vulnificus]|uniref:hypothetical protein n=1 Tax=Vibrio vulnificus TaxID=672 RepID=UPI001CDB51F3|nr:hypothetical protein [Vibrio vulnificus]EHK9050378.1 hypothetical protein [Vibrio vulnificus]ELB7646032.1 hypothetical protein [Vibrio vulnificus]ELH4869430.1 hypothetical protein [Vibrio vulnificus]MCA3895187.1 hypothetical protein [Vibrio vulnificus]MCU8238541.1 hypothetical protein [Vibrio vulnificus]
MKYAIVFFMLLASGCSSFTSPARYHELDDTKSYWLDYDATRRGTIVSNGNTNWKSCAEPTPDAAMNLVSKLNGSADIAGKGKVSGSGELNQSIVKLAEKTQMVMFLRESMYRLCELSLNSNLTPEQINTLYKSVIDSSIKVIETERLLAQKEATQAEQAKLEATARLHAADQAEFIYQFLHANNVEPAVIEKLLKSMK